MTFLFYGLASVAMDDVLFVGQVIEQQQQQQQEETLTGVLFNDCVSP